VSRPTLMSIMLARHAECELAYKDHEGDVPEMSDENLAILRQALGLPEKTKAYRPYCLRCDLMPRVALREWGFECWHCHNRFGFDLKHIDRTLAQGSLKSEATS